MDKPFSTKLDTRVLKLLDQFCQEHHLKKSSFLEEIIEDGVRRRAETMVLATSIHRGLEDERGGNLRSEDEVETLVFGKKKKF